MTLNTNLKAKLEKLRANEALTARLTDKTARAVLDWAEQHIQADPERFEAFIAAVRAANRAGAKTPAHALQIAQQSLAQFMALQVNAPPTATRPATKATRPAPTQRRASTPQVSSKSTPPQAGGVLVQMPAGYTGLGAWYRVFFTKPFYPETPENRFGGLDEQLAVDIASAKHSVDIAAFEIDLRSVADALIFAHNRGVRIRIVSDTDSYEETPEAKQIKQQLEGAGIAVSMDTRSDFMHNKIIIIDGLTVWTGSWNLTYNCTFRNNNNTLRFQVPRLAENYQYRFEELIAGRMGSEADKFVPNPFVTVNGAAIENYFSPDGDSAMAIEARLAHAQQSIKVMAYSFTADAQADLLVQKHTAGLLVQVVMEDRNATGTGSEYQKLKDAGIDVLTDGNCYCMHHKVYIIDGQTVIMGSYNFSASAEEDNDENMLIIDDPSLAFYFSGEFNRVFDQALNGECSE